MLATPRHSRWLVALLLLSAGALLLALDVAARPAPDPPAPLTAPLPPAALGPSRVQSASDTAAAKLAPDLRQAMQAATDPDTRLPVLVVSRAPLHQAALLGAVPRPPNDTGLIFTTGQIKAGQVGVLAADPQV